MNEFLKDPCSVGDRWMEKPGPDFFQRLVKFSPGQILRAYLWWLSWTTTIKKTQNYCIGARLGSRRHWIHDFYENYAIQKKNIEIHK